MKLDPHMHYLKTDERIGRRVEIPAWSDQWMRGARFGEVRHVIRDSRRPNEEIGAADILCVKLDNPRIRRQYRHQSKEFTFL